MQQNCEEDEKAIIFVSSILLRKGFGLGGVSPYYATKYGLNGFAICVFEDIRHLGIKVSSICPGLVNTELGTKKGPVDYISGEQQIQGSDVSKSIEYVLSCSASACPTAIYIDTQLHSRVLAKMFVERVEALSNAKL